MASAAVAALVESGIELVLKVEEFLVFSVVFVFRGVKTLCLP